MKAYIVKTIASSLLNRQNSFRFAIKYMVNTNGIKKCKNQVQNLSEKVKKIFCPKCGKS